MIGKRPPSAKRCGPSRHGRIRQRYNVTVPDFLDYRNANAPDPPRGPRPVVRVAVPAEFEALVTRSDDFAAARAIEDELRRRGVDVFGAVEATVGGHVVLLYVRAADRARAEEVAGAIFLRRKRVKSLPKQDVPPVRLADEHGAGW